MSGRLHFGIGYRYLTCVLSFDYQDVCLSQFYSHFEFWWSGFRDQGRPSP